jgi:phosphoglycolate phosphatase-like HAD superfamily hydrolase
LRDLSAKEVIRFLGISSWTLPFLIKKLRQNVQIRILELMPVQGMPKIIQGLKDQGILMGILTSNSEENVRSWLRMHNLNLFDFIYTGNNLFGKDKHLKVITKKIANASQINIYYVGDEVRDIEAARQAQLKGIAVTWGYNSQKILLTASPDHLCTKTKDLAFFIKSNGYDQGDNFL